MKASRLSFIAAFVVFLIALASSVFTRVETGHVGIRIGWDKQISTQEVPAGSFTQEITGTTLSAVSRDIQADVTDAHPLTSEGVPLADFDLRIVYNVDDNQIADLYAAKSKTYNGVSQRGSILPMQARIAQIAYDSSNTVLNGYPTDQLNSKREEIRSKIGDLVLKTLRDEGISGVQIVSSTILNMQPNAEITAKATKLAAAIKDLQIAETQKEAAKKEAERMTALAESGPQSIAYMDAQSRAAIANAIASGKVQSIVVPMDFKGLIATSIK